MRARGEFRWDDSLAKVEAVGGRGDGERDRGVRESEGRVPVAVFVDEDASEITRVCDAIGCDHAQLHGDGARDALETLPMRLKAIWVLNADANGQIVTKFPETKKS